MWVVDLDGTIADIAHRRHLVEKTESRDKSVDWRAFFAACTRDTPIEPVVKLLRAMLISGFYIEIWSGRSDEVEWTTVEWLREHVFYGIVGWDDPEHHHYVHLQMRAQGDNTPDAQLKEKWLDEALAAGHDIEAVIDDRARVVQMWRRRGLLCFQVAEGDY